MLKSSGFLVFVDMAFGSGIVKKVIVQTVVGRQLLEVIPVTVVLLSGAAFDGVVYGTAAGNNHGYFMGFNAIYDLLKVDENDMRAGLIGIKYFHHKAGEVRSNVPEIEKDFALTMLVGSGCWRQRVWIESPDQSLEVLLTAPGDYVAWGRDGIKHWWSAIHTSTMLTVRWNRRA